MDLRFLTAENAESAASTEQVRVGDVGLSRREMLTRALPAFALVTLGLGRQQGQGPTDSAVVARLQMPDLAGRPLGPITDYENDPRIIAIEKKIRCQCGCNLDVYTCRTTDFNCTTSPKMHAEVVALVKQGETAQQILATFVAENGEAVLMAPPARGFNLLAYFLPGVVITAVGAVIAWVVVRRQHLAPRPAATAGVDAGAEPTNANLSAAERAELAAELDQLEL